MKRRLINVVDNFFDKHNPIYSRQNIPFDSPNYPKEFSSLSIRPTAYSSTYHPSGFQRKNHEGFYLNRSKAAKLVKPALITAGLLGATGLAAALPSIIKSIKKRNQLKRLSNKHK